MNSQVPVAGFEKYCPLSSKAKDTINKAIDRLVLNGRDYVKVLRVARTIADINDTDVIKRK